MLILLLNTKSGFSYLNTSSFKDIPSKYYYFMKRVPLTDFSVRNYLVKVSPFIFIWPTYLAKLYYIFYKNLLDMNTPQSVPQLFLELYLTPPKAFYKSSGISSSVVVFS